MAAVQERYKFLDFLWVFVASLQGIAERLLPCNYNVLQFVCALSRRKRGSKSRRGHHVFSSFHAKALGQVYRTSLLQGSTDCSLVPRRAPKFSVVLRCWKAITRNNES